MRPLLAITAMIAALALQGCITTAAIEQLSEAAPTQTTLATIDAHLDNATAIATAAQDAAGMACWPVLKAWVDTLPFAQSDAQADPVLPPATGPSGEIETLRIKAKAAHARLSAAKAKLAALRGVIEAGIPDQVVTACAVVVFDAKSIAAKILAVAGIAAGI